MKNSGGQEEGRRMNPDSSSGIYVTASVEAHHRLISQSRKMKEEEKIKSTNVNALKRAAHINQRAKSFAKLSSNIPNDMIASEDNYNPLLQVLLSLSTDTIKDSYKHLGGNMGELPDLKKRTVAAAVVQKLGERIWVMGSEAKAF